MAKTLIERGFPIIDVHGHQGNLKKLLDGSRGMQPPITKPSSTPNAPPIFAADIGFTRLITMGAPVLSGLESSRPMRLRTRGQA